MGGLVQQRPQHLDRTGGQALPTHKQLGTLGGGDPPAPLGEVAELQLAAAAGAAGGHRHDHLGDLGMPVADLRPGALQRGYQHAGGGAAGGPGGGHAGSSRRRQRRNRRVRSVWVSPA
jgi:hypothetical protein